MVQSFLKLKKEEDQRFSPAEYEGDKEKGLWEIFVDDSFLYSAHVDKVVRVWDKTTGKIVKTFSGHTSDVGAVTGDDRYIYTGAAPYDNSIRVWTKDGKLVKEIKHHLASVLDLVVDGDRLYLLRPMKVSQYGTCKSLLSFGHWVTDRNFPAARIVRTNNHKNQESPQRTSRCLSISRRGLTGSVNAAGI